MILHEIRKPNSLKTVPSGVANYRNLPSVGRRREAHRCVFQGRKIRRVATTFIRGKRRKNLMQSYPARALDRRLQVDWVKDPREGPRVLMSLRVDFEPMG